MAGHSKWAQIKRQKGTNDAKRGAVFTKIGNQIAIAARKGADPEMNPALAAVIETAKAANMPKANIERALARAADKNAAQLEEINYEAYGPGGAGLIIATATDNRNRTFPEVKSTLSKNGAQLADQGSVMFQFEYLGEITAPEKSEDIIMLALEAGAKDIDETGDELVIYTEPQDLMAVRDQLIQAGTKIASADLSYVANQELDLSEEDQEKLLRVMEAIDDLDDVVNVYTNANLD